MNSLITLPFAQFVICLINFISHMIALPTSYWAYFEARTELGVPEERGHYGLFGLCSVKAPYFIEDCDPLDTFFRPPSHTLSAGIIAILHALVLTIFGFTCFVRLRQIRRYKPVISFKPKTIGIAKIASSGLACILSGSILLLTSVNGRVSPEQAIFHSTSLENYSISKGWGFKMQICITLTDMILTCLCAIENYKISRIEMQLASYSNYDSPTYLDSSLANSIEYLNPYFRNIAAQERSDTNNTNHTTASEPIQLATISDKVMNGWDGFNSQDVHENIVIPTDKLTATSFSNPAFVHDENTTNNTELQMKERF